MTRALAFAHRWIGIPAGLMVIVWFLSGFVMMYAGGMPRISQQARLDRLQELDLEAVRLMPAEAAAHAGLNPEFAGPPVLAMLDGRPAWRFPGAPPVFADDGTALAPLDVAAARRVAARFLREPAPGLEHAGTVTAPDQWTLSQRRALPLEKFLAHDAAGTELYVSPATGEVVQATTRRQRALAWAGTIPHWLYFGGLRVNQPVWYRIVVVLSSVVCVLAVLGLVLAAIRWSPSRPFRWSRSIPYRGGMRWHYIAGSIFGLFIFTWAFSGLMSMEPWDWTNAPELRVAPDTFTGGPVELSRYDPAQLPALARLAQPRFVKELTLQRIHGGHFWDLRTSAHDDTGALPRERLHAPYDVAGGGEDGQMLVDTATLAPRVAPFGTTEILARLAAALPGTGLAEVTQLTDYDDYYYSRSRQTPLPVLRVKLDDPMATWLYIDTRTSRIVSNVHRYSRIERWLYNGLHSLDFRFWHAKRPLWDIGMILLLTGGLVTSAVGLWIGLRRIFRPRPSL